MAKPRIIADAEFKEIMDPVPFAFGTSRTVHDVTSDSDVVVKQSRDQFSGQNSNEWQIYVSVFDAADPESLNVYPTAKTLLPLLGRCLAISPSRRFLLMERLEDLTDTDRNNMPKFPVWLTDKKLNAFGKDAYGRIKVRDYGHAKIGGALANAQRV